VRTASEIEFPAGSQQLLPAFSSMMGFDGHTYLN
jgi:hypothetical protein